jgi:cell division protein FtsA
VSALESVAQGLDLTLVTLMSTPLALARYLDRFTDENGGAVVIDIGHGTTDIALIRYRRIEEIRSLAKGELDFTQCIAREMRVNLIEAERIKIGYSNNDRDIWRYKRIIHDLLYEECQHWIENIQKTLQTMAKTDVLPSTLNIVGGCSLLLDLYQALEHGTWKEMVPFSSSPILQRLELPSGLDIVKTTDIFTGPASMTPMALAFRVLEIEDETNIVAEILKRITQD